MITRNDCFRAYLKRERIACNCGGLQDSTEHAPDCNIERAWYNFVDFYNQGEYENFDWETYIAV